MRMESRTGNRRVAKAAGVLVLSILAYVSAVTVSAPTWAQAGCDWYGTRPFCNGQCPSGFVYTGQREACTTGSRRFCCPAKYVTPGINCKWVGHPGNMLWVCDDPMLKFYLKNSCNVRVAVKVEYLPINRSSWSTNNYQFGPGETGYLVDTKNRYIFVTANAVGGNQRWARQRIDMGDKLGKTHTHTLTCR